MMQKILIIEDEQDIRETIIDIVRYSGYDCRALEDGEGAAACALEYRPDLIICDILLPTVDGYSVILELQQRPETATIPFIFLTAKATYEDIRKGMSLGADDYLTKPFTAEQLVEAINKRLSRFRKIAAKANEQSEYFKDFLKMTLPHELRTPMSGIMGYLSLLIDGFDDYEPEQIRQMLQRMNVATKRLYHIIENYILYAQLTTISGDRELTAKLREYSYCLECTGVIQHRAEQKALEYHRPDDIQIAVENSLVALNTESVEKIVAELVDNAFKFSNPGQPVRVRGGVTEDGRYELQISDEGRGMSADQIGQLEALRQFNRHQFEQQGLGLGMAIVQQIVALAAGELHIVSEPEQGTSVTIRLPVRDRIPRLPEATLSTFG